MKTTFAGVVTFVLEREGMTEEYFRYTQLFDGDQDKANIHYLLIWRRRESVL